MDPWVSSQRGRSCCKGAVSPSRHQQIAGGEAALFGKRKLNNTQTVFAIFPNLAFLVVKLLPALLPVCMSVTGEHCWLWTTLSKMLSEQGSHPSLHSRL